MWHEKEQQANPMVFHPHDQVDQRNLHKQYFKVMLENFCITCVTKPQTTTFFLVIKSLVENEHNHKTKLILILRFSHI